MQKLWLKPVLGTLLFALILSGIFFNSVPTSSTQTATVITSNTTWSKADSPITLQGKVLVKDGATLTIEAGTTVEFGNYNLRVEGGATLNARGTTSNPIIFKGTGELSGIELVTSTSWNEQTSSGTIIDNAIIDFAYLSTDNAKISNSKITATNCFAVSGIFAVVSNNDITSGNAYFDGGKIMHNTIKGNIVTQFSPEISYNTITGSITISGHDDDQPVLTHNTIQGEITQFHACLTLSYNDISGKILLSNGSPTVTYNTLHNGLSLTDKNGTISNNNIVGGKVGIAVGAIFQHIRITIKDNVISGCTTAGISASMDSDDIGDVTLTISGNVIKDCNYGIDLSGVEATVQGNLFVNNKYGLVGRASIQHNTFSGNEVGVSSLGNVNYNNFLTNKYGFSLQTPKLYIDTNVNAPNNWWGTTDTEAIKQTLFDYKNDYDLGTITFEPILTSPDLTAPSTSYNPATGPSADSTPTTIPTTEPYQNPTAQPTTMQPTTENPIQPNTQTGTSLGLEFKDLLIVLLGITLAASVLTIVFLLRHRRKRSFQ